MAKKWTNDESKPPRVERPKADVKHALEAFHDLCFYTLNGTAPDGKVKTVPSSHICGEADVALSALYSRTAMNAQHKIGRFNVTEDAVKMALAALFVMEKDPEKYRYKPSHPSDSPATPCDRTVTDVVDTLIQAIERDFKPEITSLTEALNAGHRR